MEHTCIRCGALHWLDERVQKSGSTNTHPLFSMCCGDGSVQLPALLPPPDPLQQLFSASTPESRELHENIRQYNAALSFTSLGAQVDNSVNEAEVDPRCSRSTANSTTKSAPSSLPADGRLPMPSYTSSTLTRRWATGCGETLAWTLM